MFPAWRSRPASIAVVGTLAVVAGLALYWLAPKPAAEFGWFGYAPPSNAVLASLTGVQSAGQHWGTALASLGALLISGALGHRFGRRPTPGPGSASEPSGPA